MAKNIYNYIVEIYALHYTECVMKALLRKTLEDTSRKLGRRLSVSLLGLGSTNTALLGLLLDMDDLASVTVRHPGITRGEIPDTVALIGTNDALSNLPEDVIFPSPSVRRDGLALRNGAQFISDYDLFFSSEPKHLFSVSGSDGKSTTVSMASELLFPRFPDIFTGGNCGVPLWNASLDRSAFLLELSSFTLRYSKPIGGRALITNVTPNHLDWHESLKEYEETKLELLYTADEPIVNLDDEVSERFAKEYRTFCLISTVTPRNEIITKYKTEHTITLENGKILVDGEAIVSLEDVKHKESHNVRNLESAIALSLGYTTAERIREVASSYRGLDERCERFDVGGVHYISSSIDTTPERTKTTLLGLGEKVRLILGGRGKGLSLEPLRDVLKKYATKIAIYGEISSELLSFIESDAELKEIPHEALSNLEDAINYVKDTVDVGETILLSPAATSYGEFKDYKERGRFFKANVRTLGEKK